MWTVFWLQNSVQYNFLKLGVLPRDPASLTGIITSVFIHADLNHIASNTIPLLVLGMMLFYFYKKIAKPVFFWVWLVSGIWLWVGGRNNPNYPIYHVGASTLIYGLAGFLFFSGLFRRHLQLMVVSALVVFLYGGIMWGIFPVKEGISWEGHLFGLIAGILVAFNYRREGPQRKVYQWEEDDDDDENPADFNTMQDNPDQQNFTFQYHYKEKKDPDPDIK
ncbi:MAG: rhomboid family intramembrane serine protease [Bacteroidia bacterium]|nr:rhomboid family intramembrane serine protease [Bacteroidia bacterium]